MSKSSQTVFYYPAKDSTTPCCCAKCCTQHPPDRPVKETRAQVYGVCRPPDRPEKETVERVDCSQGIPSPTKEGINLLERFPPPGPPEGWQLQYCNWWGWTWVKKLEEKRGEGVIEVKPKKEKPVVVKRKEIVARKEKPPKPDPVKKKKKNWLQKCFCCQCDDDEPTPKTAYTQYSRQRVCYFEPGRRNVSEECFYDDCCNSGDCPEMCCDCLREAENKPKLCCNETQTEVEQIEQATSTCPLNPPKPRHIRRCCNCHKKFCCPCAAIAGCDSGFSKSRNQSRSCGNNETQTERMCPTKQIVNRCLIDVQPDLGGFKSYRSRCTPVELLLKNNENLIKMIVNKKLLLGDEKIPSFLKPSEGFQNNWKITNSEHCKLLTSVCDAILANKKTVKENFSEFDYKNFKIGQETESIFDLSLNTALLQNKSLDIFNDLGSNYPDFSLTRTEKNDAAAVQTNVKVNAEIGVQVNDVINSNKTESGAQTAVTKIMESPRTRTFPSKASPVTKTEVLSAHQELASSRGFERTLCFLSNANDTGKLELETKIKTIRKESRSNRKSIAERSKNSGSDASISAKLEKPSGERIEELVNDCFVSGLSQVNVDSFTCLLEACRQDNYKPLDATSPPFTELDLHCQLEET